MFKVFNKKPKQKKQPEKQQFPWLKGKTSELDLDEIADIEELLEDDWNYIKWLKNQINVYFKNLTKFDT